MLKAVSVISDSVLVIGVLLSMLLSLSTKATTFVCQNREFPFSSAVRQIISLLLVSGIAYQQLRAESELTQLCEVCL